MKKWKKELGEATRKHLKLEKQFNSLFENEDRIFTEHNTVLVNKDSDIKSSNSLISSLPIESVQKVSCSICGNKISSQYTFVVS